MPLNFLAQGTCETIENKMQQKTLARTNKKNVCWSCYVCYHVSLGDSNKESVIHTEILTSKIIRVNYDIVNHKNL